MYHPTYELISGYNEWLTQLAAEGRTLWLGTVLFHHLGRSQPITLSLMEKEMQRIYKGLVTNTTRNLELLLAKSCLF